VAPGASVIEGMAPASAATPLNVAELSCNCAVTLPVFCTSTVTLHPAAPLVITGAPPKTMETVAVPLETTRLTADPVLTEAPATGLWLITLPEGTVTLLAVLTVPSVSPAPVIALVAAACVRPTTLGTVAEAGPELTVRFTAEPEATLVPATGLCLITLPEGTVTLLAVLTVPSVSPAPVIALVAAACVRPTTLGTDTDAGPLLTVKFTAEPEATLVPATGLWLITLPEGTVALLAVVMVPTVSPAPVIAVAPAACVSPTTFGTATEPLPAPFTAA
jgi:hypothetical protein